MLVAPVTKHHLHRIHHLFGESSRQPQNRPSPRKPAFTMSSQEFFLRLNTFPTLPRPARQTYPIVGRDKLVGRQF